MANIWVLCSSLPSDSSQSVRADDITHLIASTEKLTASRLGSDTVVTLAHRDWEGLGVPVPNDLPEDFGLALLAKLAEARKQAQNSEEDLVLLADLDDNRQWDWSVFPISELWPG
ncbi:hypothetical protein [Streptomyces noursei]|uniref:Uncharacterized protein n=1 Tax=Streptomyces noursei TaxID=1971 RepID=A0A2N8PQZ0_STRNR|nr:hypothetical protein [Streptomyces noursei]PNE43442.1 hypothetical protein AOB60_00470 [Streptomyces noursei]